MKKALNLIIMYITTLFTGIVMGTVLYSFYINVLNFVAGAEIQFFTKKDILTAFFYISFCVLFLVCPLISYYRIRHPGGLPQMITFIALSFLTWAVLIPCVYSVSSKYTESHSITESPENLSKGYFRQVDNKVYYFTKDFNRNETGIPETTAVVIETGENGNVGVENIKDTPNLDLNKEASPYREVLVKNTFKENMYPLSVNFRRLISICVKNMNDGFFPFLGYLSIGLVLCSIFALTNAFRWKLINTLVITILSFAVLILNSCPLIAPLKFLETKICNTGFYEFLSDFGTEPIMVFMNCLFSVIFILTGVILFIVRKHKEKK